MLKRFLSTPVYRSRPDTGKRRAHDNFLVYFTPHLLSSAKCHLAWGTYWISAGHKFCLPFFSSQHRLQFRAESRILNSCEINKQIRVGVVMGETRRQSGIEVSKIRNQDLGCNIDVAHCYFVEVSGSYSLYYLGWAEMCCCNSERGSSNKDLFLVHDVCPL